MTIFFTNAPAQITHRVLPLLRENGKKYPDLKIVAPKELRPFLKQATDARILETKVHPNLITRKTKREFLSNVIKSKLEYRKIFKEIRGEDIYLFFNCWSIVYLSYVVKLSKHNHVYYYPENDSCVIQREEKSFRSLAMRLFSKIMLGVDTVVMNKADLPIWELKEDSIPMEVIHYDNFDGVLPPEMMKNPDAIKGKEIIFFPDDVVCEGSDEQSVIDITDYLMDILDSKYSGRYVIKPHPREQVIYGKMNLTDPSNIVDPLIFAEMLFNHKWRFVIGYYAEALITAKKRTEAKVISLLYLWKMREDLREYWYKRFEEEGVLMPKTRDELKYILEEEK